MTKPTKKTVYICGPITGRKDLNIQAFRKWECKLEEMGYTALVPHDVAKELDISASWEAYMKKDIPAMLQCDIVVTLEDWYESPGAKLEVHIARELSIPIVMCHSMKPADQLIHQENG